MKMRLVFYLCIAVASAALAHSALSQQPARVALLIGNANYPDASTPLSTTIRDARTLADEFRRTEFDVDRSEEHTSELQSQFHLVCRLLLEKKKKKKIRIKKERHKKHMNIKNRHRD